MAWHLYRLGRWSFRRRKLVIFSWLLTLLIGIVGAVSLSGPTNDTFSIGGIESTEAFELIKERNPQAAPDGAQARLVIRSQESRALTAAPLSERIEAALESLAGEEVQAVVSPFQAGTITEDGRVAYATILYDRPATELPSDAVDRLEAAVAKLDRSSHMEASVGGDAVQGEQEAPLGEILGIGVAMIVLFLTLGSLVAAGMPLLTALIGVGVGMTALTTASGFMDLSSSTPALGTMLGLAVGIDYALFIMSRYQHEVRGGRAHEEAAGVAVGTAGSAVVFAGLTVVIALAGLALCGVGFLTQMGVAAAFVVLLSVLIALTLLPALLGLARHRVVRDKSRELRAAGDEEPNRTGARYAAFLSRHRAPVFLAGLLLALAAAIPAASLQLALPDDGTAPMGTDRREAYDTIAEGFGPGANGPLLVVVDTRGAGNAQETVEAALATVQDVADGGGVAAVVPPLVSSRPADVDVYEAQLASTGLATITVVPETGPSSQATKDLVERLRGSLDGLEDGRALVTGQTAVGVDISDKLASVFPLYLSVVVGLALILLVLVFRSLWVPLKAAAGFLLSLGVSLGLTVAVFQWGWAKAVVGLDTEGPIMFLLPILLTGILFGLAMDYEVFLVTRIREAWVHGTEARAAVVEGFAHSARVVTAAALIMGGVFVGFALTEDPIIKVIGFALAVGVLSDAFLVRMVLVPTCMMLVGERMWALPAWLDRRLPNLDIEGEDLLRRLDHDSH